MVPDTIIGQQSGTTHGSHTPAACSFPGANARSWAGLGEAALCYRAWAQTQCTLKYEVFLAIIWLVGASTVSGLGEH